MGACNAHKIRKIRHLRGAKARCMSERIRAIGAIREYNIRVVSQDSNIFFNNSPVNKLSETRCKKRKH